MEPTEIISKVCSRLNTIESVPRRLNISHKIYFSYSSSIDSEADPVVKFAFQEPENDPRNYCYLWVVRGQTMNDLIK